MNKYVLSGIAGGVVVLAGLALFAMNPGLFAPKPTQSQIRERVTEIVSNSNVLLREMDYATIPGDEYGSGRFSVEGYGFLADPVYREDPEAFLTVANLRRTEEEWTVHDDRLDEAVPVEKRHVKDAIDWITRSRPRDKVFFEKVYSRESLRVPFSVDGNYHKTVKGIELGRYWSGGVDKRVISNAGIILNENLRRKYSPYFVLGEDSGDRILDEIRRSATNNARDEALKEKAFDEQSRRFVEVTSQDLYYRSEAEGSIEQPMKFFDCGNPREYDDIRSRRERMIYRKITVDCTATLSSSWKHRYRWVDGFNIHPGESRPARLELIFPVKATGSEELPDPGAMMCLEQTELDEGRGGPLKNRFKVGETVCKGWHMLMPWRPDMDGFTRHHNVSDLAWHLAAE